MIKKDDSIDVFVAVWMVTYNHELFIEEAVESVMCQKTTFKYKLFLSDDNSTDKTQLICEKLKNKYPDKIFLNFNKQNQGSKKNGVENYHRCFKSGAKYTALIEGDDYWIDEYKLQKQVDFLESNESVTVVGHSVKILREDNEIVEWNVKNGTFFTFEEYLLKNNLFTVSVMFRNVLKEIPDLVYTVPAGDFYIKSLLLEKGNGYFMGEYMSVYRMHQGGVWSTLVEAKAHKNYIKSLRSFIGIFPKNKKGIQKAIVKYKLKYKLFFKDFSIYIFRDFFEIVKIGIKKNFKSK